MAKEDITRYAGWLAIGLAVLGGIIALANEALSYHRGEPLDWGHIALAVGVPLLMYSIVRSAAGKRA
jgi:hypothetical protein